MASIPENQSQQSTGPLDPQRRAQQRTVLSCTKCRERKVKCNRTKPCDACCARGIPKECEFVIGEGNDFVPVQQSYELRKLRKANERLKNDNYRLKEENQSLKNGARMSHSVDEGDDDDDDGRSASQSSSRAAGARQRRFKTNDRVDNIYFGTPGLANVVNEFARLQVGDRSLTHTLPQLARQVYAVSPSMYPFHAMWFKDNTPLALTKLLPDPEQIYELLESFQQRAQSCSFPHVPDAISRKEVERFLDDLEGNAEKHPDMLALLFTTLATGMQVGQYDRDGGEWVAGKAEKTRQSSDVFVACSMQALRLASFMNQPTLLGIQTLVLMCFYLTNSARFIDGWTLFGTIVRMAHAIGLHRNPELLNPAPSMRECFSRRTLWWWILHMDQEYSVTLGRPLGISGIGDCPPPTPLTTNPTMLRLGDFTHHFTILARQILGSDGLLSVGKVDEFTDKLVGLWDTMPEALQFNETWLQTDTPLPDWPLEAMSAQLFAKLQCYLIILNRQRIARTQNSTRANSPSTSPRNDWNDPHNQHVHNQRNQNPPARPRGRPLVIKSCINIIQTFLFFHCRNPAVLICWTLGQQAFSACMILILDAWETENEQNEKLISQAYGVFTELQNKGVHQLASLAVQRISDGLVQIGNRKAERERLEMERTRRNSLAAVAMQQHHNQQRHLEQQQQQNLQHPYSQQTMQLFDTPSIVNLSNEAVMSNTGMFLLEDHGLQPNNVTQPFSPLTWNMADSSTGSVSSSYRSSTNQTPSPKRRSPTVPNSANSMAAISAGMSTPGTSTPTTYMGQPALQSSPFPPPPSQSPSQPPNFYQHQRRTTLATYDPPHFVNNMPPPPLANSAHNMFVTDATSFSGPASTNDSFDSMSDSTHYFAGNANPFHTPRRQSFPQGRPVRHSGQRGGDETPNRGGQHQIHYQAHVTNHNQHQHQQAQGQHQQHHHNQQQIQQHQQQHRSSGTGRKVDRTPGRAPRR